MRHHKPAVIYSHGLFLAAMLIGPAGTALLPPSVFGLFERFSTFSAVVFNAVLGAYLLTGRFELSGGNKSE